MLFKKMISFLQVRNFHEAELNFEKVDLAAKASIMSAYSLYGINFYDEALENLNRYLTIYPADKNVMYAHFLRLQFILNKLAMKKKILEPLLEADKQSKIFFKQISKY